MNDKAPPSNELQRQAKSADASALAADSLAAGVVFMLSVTVLQRLMGFARSLLFCRFLEEEQLGQWSLAHGFLLLAAPLAVLGLPGTLGRYVEYYRSRGQLRVMLKRIALVAGTAALAAAVAALLARRWLAWMIFNDPQSAGLVLALGIGLAAVIAFNFLVELLTALRQVRAAALMQFLNSLVFAVLGVGLVWKTSLGAASAAIAYCGGCLVAALVALPWLLRCWRETATADAPLAQKSMWSKLLPLAGWVWIMNLVVNLFVATDRWMIVHFADTDASAGQALVGQYHSSRVIPMVLVGLAGMLGGVLLPYLSHDWEAGRKRQVGDQLNLAIKLIAVTFSLAGAAVLLLAPLLFGWLLQGRYDSGLAVLPWTLAYCIWFSLALVAQNYLWCAEKAKLGTLALAIGLGINVGLNCLLLPLLGLLGAVLATAAANAVCLLLIYWFNARLGMRPDGGVYLASCLPLLLALGATASSLAIALVVLSAIAGRWLFNPQEKRQLLELAHRYLNKIRPLAGKRERPAFAPAGDKETA